jgi:hypothetical protein
MLKKRVHIAPLVVVMLLVSRCTLADSVDDYLRQRMKEKHIPGAVLVELKDGKIIKQRSERSHARQQRIPCCVDHESIRGNRSVSIGSRR